MRNRLPVSIVLMTLLLNTAISASEINGRFVVTPQDSSKIAVLLQVNTFSGNIALGGATIVFGFDTLASNLTENPVKNTDYFFHNFCGGNYSPATITKPVKNRIWVNIDLPYNNNNNGTVISDTSGWTDVVTIYFDITDSAAAASFYWLTTSPFWSIYKDDNLTLLTPGSFQNVTTHIPVELTSFTVSVSGNEVILNWSTAAEVNNLLFEIQRSFEGTEFSTIGAVAGKGTTSEKQEYVYKDTISAGGRYSYRLKQIDYQGIFEYSGIIEAVVELVSSFLLEQNYPNPFNPSTKIRWQTPAGGHQTLKVYDILGNEVAVLVDEFKPAGSYEIEFIPGNLASGIYIYRLQTATYTDTKKMILLR